MVIIDRIDIESDEEDDIDDPPPQSSDPAIQWIINNMVAKSDMKRELTTIRKDVKKIQTDVKALVDEGTTQWLENHIAAIYVKYFANKSSFKAN